MGITFRLGPVETAIGGANDFPKTSNDDNSLVIDKRHAIIIRCDSLPALCVHRRCMEQTNQKEAS
jgi:hypothetical protein